VSLRVAGAQIPVTRHVAGNVEVLLRAVEFAASQKADVLLTPEGSLSGYHPGFDEGEVAAALETVTSRARDAGVGLALGTCYRESDGKCYNQIRLYSPDGEFLGFHAKTLRCAGEVQDYSGAPLRTFDLKGIAVGGLICNDMWANPDCTPMPDPNLARQLGEQGARVILHAVNGGRSAGERSRVVWRFHEANLQMRAMAAGAWIVTCDNCDPQDRPCSAPCGVVDPEGNWRLRTPPQGEQFFTYTIVLE
jgi:predicted amidohydrolase